MPKTFPNIPPDRNSKQSVEHKILRADFGDGYAQTAPNGRNNIDRQWALSFNGYPADLVDQIVAFLDARGSSESFYWTPPFETSPTLWKQVGKYDISYPGGTAKSLSVTIKQVPL